MQVVVNDERRAGHIALIGNFLPRKCGLATFTTDTFNALRDRFLDVQVDVYAMDDRGTYDFPPEVTRTIRQDDRLAYSEAARAIEDSGAQVLWVQHEYGIYGGVRSEEHTSEIQSIMRISYDVFCLKKKKNTTNIKE